MQHLTEARRTWLYGIIGAAVPLLLGYGVLAPEHVTLWLNLAAAVLAVGSSTLAATHVGESGVDYEGRHRKTS